MAKRSVRTARGGNTTIVWELSRTDTRANGSTTRFFALRSDGKLLTRYRCSYRALGRVQTDSGLWSIARPRGTDAQEFRTKLMARGFTEKA